MISKFILLIILPCLLCFDFNTNDLSKNINLKSISLSDKLNNKVDKYNVSVNRLLHYINKFDNISSIKFEKLNLFKDVEKLINKKILPINLNIDNNYLGDITINNISIIEKKDIKILYQLDSYLYKNNILSLELNLKKIDFLSPYKISIYLKIKNLKIIKFGGKNRDNFGYFDNMLINIIESLIKINILKEQKILNSLYTVKGSIVYPNDKIESITSNKGIDLKFLLKSNTNIPIITKKYINYEILYKESIKYIYITINKIKKCIQ